MNTPIEPKDQDSLPQIDEQRRRLSKGGLAAPIVLGTLLSRPVLGAAPYNCTISGKLSGNTSSHGKPLPCNTLGRSPGYWGNRAEVKSWGSCKRDAKFNTVFANAYPDKTLLQVIQSGGGMTLMNNHPALGRAAVASWLNAYHMTDFPLTQPQVVAMFNAVYAGGKYQVNASTSWDANLVMTYFESLYEKEKDD
jgi:hypothetical protein